jgi:carotenoid phi-ring synthase / carotenoid chi-ring synthase
VLGPDGQQESFGGLPTTAPLNLLALLRRTPFLALADLRRIDGESFRSMIAFDPQRSYATHDGFTAKEYLDRLALPPHARQLLFRVFGHAVFNLEESVSAAEMLAMLHYYFLTNPEGVSFDVIEEPTGDVLWKPLERYLTTLGATLRMGVSATRVELERGDRVRVEVSEGEALSADGLVIAAHVPGVRALFAASPSLSTDADLSRAVASLATSPTAVTWRLYLDRAARPERPAYGSVTGMGALGSVTLLDRFEGESRRFARRTGGSVVHLQAFGGCCEMDDGAVRAELRASLDALYPELAGARVVHESLVRHTDCPAFSPGSHASRPRVATPYGNVALAGDWVKLPFPSAMMERAVASGMLAANQLLDRWDVRGETLWTVPPRGFLASLTGLMR